MERALSFEGPALFIFLKVIIFKVEKRKVSPYLFHRFIFSFFAVIVKQTANCFGTVADRIASIKNFNRIENKCCVMNDSGSPYCSAVLGFSIYFQFLDAFSSRLSAVTYSSLSTIPRIYSATELFPEPRVTAN